MTLVNMISLDENALICDFAETYSIYDYHQLPARKAAILAVGLRDNSRIKMKMRNDTVETNTYLLAGIVDFLYGIGNPEYEPVINQFINANGKYEVKEIEKYCSFSDEEEFERKRAMILGA